MQFSSLTLNSQRRKLAKAYIVAAYSERKQGDTDRIDGGDYRRATGALAVELEVELVERKGKGHPDSICDGIAKAGGGDGCPFHRCVGNGRNQSRHGCEQPGIRPRFRGL